MRLKSNHSIEVVLVLVLVVAILSVKPVIAQNASMSSLADQLKAEYKLAKRGSDSSGSSIVEAGAVFVIQKGGILGVPLSNATMAPATYKDGDLHGPGVGGRMFIGNSTRQLTIGEKVYVTQIDVHPKNDKIMLVIVECDSCNGVQQPSSYKSAIVFQFPKNYLSKADVTQVKDVISQVLIPDTSPNDQQAQNSSNQPSPVSQSASAPTQIQLGQTIEQVQAALGQPEKIVNLGAKQIYVYRDLKVTFIDGKVSDVQ